MSKEEKEYLKKTGELPIYNNIPTDAYKRWLERKDMKEAIEMVIEHEKNDLENAI